MFRWLGAAMLGLGAALPHLPGEPGLACPLRELTGVPCPMCGMTTSVKAVMRADPGAALAANPFGLLAVLAAVVLLVQPRLRVLRVPVAVIAAVAAVSWVVQLRRFGLV